MKTLLVLASVLTSSSAFAFTPAQLIKALNAPVVKNELTEKNILKIEDGPSFRCMGCYGIDLETTSGSYRIQIMDFAGRFNASIAKME